jgi:sugar/nucleoside kinase (ribokinase family)
MPIDLVAFGIVIDDVVFPDGRTAMGRLGGGGPQAAFGMRLWSDSVGLVARVGRDLPDTARDWLARSGIDLAGVVETDLPTPRAWQVLEADGKRTQVWRVPGKVIGEQLGRSVERIPEAYRQARGFHFGIHPDEPDLGFARALAALGGVVSIEPFKPAERPFSPETLSQLAAAAPIISPNLEEAISMAGDGEPEEFLKTFAHAGAQVVPLRRGAEGSLVFDGRTGRIAHIPAYPVHVADPIGAGNAYCGGFLAGWLQTGDVVTAGLYGSVAASFILETGGLPFPDPALREEALSRVDRLRPEVRISG